MQVPSPANSLPAAPEVATQSGWMGMFESISWFDWSALACVAVFFVLGLFKGFWWQVSRVVTLVAAWLLAGHLGPRLAAQLGALIDPATSPANLALFLAYLLVFVGVVVVLSVLAHFVQKLIKDTQLGLYDRLGGALLGTATGGLLVMAVLAGIYMFVPEKMSVVGAAQRSHAMEVSQRALRLLGDGVPEPMRRVFQLDETAPATAPAGPGLQPIGREPAKK